MLTGTLTGATTEKEISRTSESWIGTLTTLADLGAAAEAVYGLGKEAYVGLLDAGGNLVSSRRITEVDVDAGEITVAGGWDSDPAAG